jgi:putative heme transporter
VDNGRGDVRSCTAVNRVWAHAAETTRRARAVPARAWVATLVFAATSWLLDLACLAAVAHACHLTVGYGHLAGIYLAAQGARQIPVTRAGSA